MNNNCKLCQNAPCKPKAHIFPRWVYGKIIDPKPAVIVSGDPEKPRSKSRSGEYDKNLVCEDCEAIFSALDTAGVRFFRDYDWDPSHFKTASLSTGERIQLRIIDNFDPALIHRFILSLAWRCSSTTRWFFEDFSLGNREHAVRKILLDQSLDSLSKFSTVITRYFPSKKYPELDPEQYFSTPKTARFDGFQSARLSIPSFEIQISTDSRQNPNFPSSLCLKTPPFAVFGLDFSESADISAMKQIAKARFSDMQI